MMTANNDKAAAGIELLPGELMRQLVFESKPAVADGQVPVQQSRVVLPDDSDEDQIEQLDFDPPAADLSATAESDAKQQQTVSLNVASPQPGPVVKENLAEAAIDQQKIAKAAVKQTTKPRIASGPQSIPIQINMNGNKPQDLDRGSQAIPTQWHTPPNRTRQSSNGFYRPTSSPGRRSSRRYNASRQPLNSCCDGCCRKPSSYNDYFWPADLRQRGSYFTPVLPRTPDYYVYNTRPALVPLIPMIW